MPDPLVPNGKWQNFVAMLFFGLKILTSNHEIMLHAMLLKGVDDELRLRVLTAWDEWISALLIRQSRSGTRWRTYLRAHVKAKDGHFEHKLSQ